VAQGVVRVQTPAPGKKKKQKQYDKVERLNWKKSKLGFKG
jgi:hypothetical protein